ncbi:MAG: NUDIX domain-containing protein [Bacteroidota bacterium]|nr:NUDIX domain-containing protein [Bacteroidota bacterium]
MQELRKRIKESFFNPILHLLPLLIFLVVDDFFGMKTAWEVSFPVALGLLIYVYFAYNRIFAWHLIFTLIFITVSLFAFLETLLPFRLVNDAVVYELALLSFLIAFILFRKQIQKTISGIISNLIPMSNNFNELYRVIWVLFSVLSLYVLAFFTVHTTVKDDTLYLQFIQNLYIGVLIFLSTYEVLRVMIIRAKLIKEEWWPIVSSQGKIIGSIQHLTSLNDEKKYMHPVVRVILIDKGMVLLTKRASDDPESPNLWDTSISNHVRVGETIERCVGRSAEENYALNNFRFMYLSNYSVESKTEIQYAFLFVSCLQVDYTLNHYFPEQTKWWTQRQIQDNLSEGIFTENFKIEFDLLQRSGLLETGKCECACKLRDAIYHQSSAVNTAELN